MTKKETIWRHILLEALSGKARQWTQKALAAHFHISTSTVFNALQVPRAVGAIQVTGRSLRLQDAEKLLLLWATQRNLQNDVIYQARVDLPVGQIEGMMPAGAIFTAFSAYRLRYKMAPADYDQVLVYADQATLLEIQRRFAVGTSRRRSKVPANLIVLKSDPYLAQYGSLAPDVQAYVDIWNVPVWYSKDFLLALKEKLGIN